MFYDKLSRDQIVTFNLLVNLLRRLRIIGDLKTHSSQVGLKVTSRGILDTFNAESYFKITKDGFTMDKSYIIQTEKFEEVMTSKRIRPHRVRG